MSKAHQRQRTKLRRLRRMIARKLAPLGHAARAVMTTALFLNACPHRALLASPQHCPLFWKSKNAKAILTQGAGSSGCRILNLK
jgi:hypothetical protein